MEPRKISAKLVLLGDANVGKSSIVLRFAKDKFYERTEGTIGAAFLTKSLPVGKTNIVRFEIWDTAGQERYHSLAPMYYRDAKLAIVVYDITCMASFERAKSWVAELRETAPKEIIIALVGNKCDLDDSREISTQEVSQYARSNELIFKESSARSGLNIMELFMTLAQKVASSTGDQRDDDDDIDLQPPLRIQKDSSAPEEGSGICCG
mmetsp:Transcript_33866/g.95315  ORF Transcript_33866/g.95315 Transcript_33866/m.95315 type:complete len:208 (+) Transcript_33866:80-703(+)